MKNKGENITQDQGDAIKTVIDMLIDLWVKLTGGKKKQ